MLTNARRLVIGSGDYADWDCPIFDLKSLTSCNEVFDSRCTKACEGLYKSLPLLDRSRYGLPKNAPGLWLAYLTEFLSPSIKDHHAVFELFARTKVTPVPVSTKDDQQYSSYTDVWSEIGWTASGHVMTFWMSLGLFAFAACLVLLGMFTLMIPHKMSLPILSVVKYTKLRMSIMIISLVSVMAIFTIILHLFTHYFQADLFGFTCTALHDLYQILYASRRLSSNQSFHGIVSLYSRLELLRNFTTNTVTKLGNSDNVFGDSIPLLEGLFAPITWTHDLFATSTFTGWRDRQGYRSTFHTSLTLKYHDELREALFQSSDDNSTSFGTLYRKVGKAIPQIQLPTQLLNQLNQHMFDFTELLSGPVRYIDQLTHVLPQGGKTPRPFRVLIHHQKVATMVMWFLLTNCMIWLHLRRKHQRSLNSLVQSCGARSRSVLGLSVYAVLMVLTSSWWLVSTAIWFGLTHFSASLCTTVRAIDAASFIEDQISLGGCASHGDLFARYRDLFLQLEEFDAARTIEVREAILSTGPREAPVTFEPLLALLDLLDNAVTEFESTITEGYFEHASDEVRKSSISPGDFREMGKVLSSQINHTSYPYRLCVASESYCPDAPFSTAEAVVVGPESVYNYAPIPEIGDTLSRSLWALELGRDARIQEAFDHLRNVTAYRRFAEDLYVSAWRATAVHPWQRGSNRLSNSPTRSPNDNQPVYFDSCPLGQSCDLFYSTSTDFVGFRDWRENLIGDLKSLTQTLNTVGSVAEAVEDLARRAGLFHPLIEAFETASENFNCKIILVLIEDMYSEMCSGVTSDVAVIAWSGLGIAVVQGSLTFLTLAVLRNRLCALPTQTKTEATMGGLLEYSTDEESLEK